MEMVKCQACGWLGDWQDLEAHFNGKHEIPICPKCYSEKLEDVEMEVEAGDTSIPFMGSLRTYAAPKQRRK